MGIGSRMTDSAKIFFPFSDFDFKSKVNTEIRSFITSSEFTKMSQNVDIARVILIAFEI